MSRPLCGLERAARLCAEAESLYTLVGVIHGLTQPPWRELSFAAKHRYYSEVEQLVARCQPLPSGPPLFDLAVSLSRAEGARLLEFRGPDDSDGRD